jgi:OmcA/MtrC family decaheme c-type cytochrome
MRLQLSAAVLASCLLVACTGTGGSKASPPPVVPPIAVSIVDVSNTGPGASPIVTFDVAFDGAPRDILSAPLTALRATVAGPNEDYASWWQSTIQGTGATGTLSAVAGVPGRFAYALPTPMPPSATGSYTLGLEAYLDEGGARLAAESPVRAFAVTDAVATARRTTVDEARCDACHVALSGHGGARRGVQYCVLCHNSSQTNAKNAPRFEGSSVTAPSLDLGVMVHKIHAGDTLANGYVLFGFPGPSVLNPGGTPIDYGQTRFPGSLAACQTCHLAGTYALPLAAGARGKSSQVLTCVEDPTADADAYCTGADWVVDAAHTMPPETAACTSCHDQYYVAAHADLNTTSEGVESCATCHGPGAAYDVAAVHAH